MLSRWIGLVSRSKNDPGWPFRRIAGKFAAADLAFANLESPFSDKQLPYQGGMVFRGEPSMVKGLVLAGIDVVSTANNHARDGGGHGIEYTLALLAANSIQAVGTGANGNQAHRGAVAVRNGTRFGFLGYTYDQRNGNWPEDDDRVALMDVGRMRLDVKQMREKADAVIVSMHAGTEYAARPNPRQVEFARAAVDAGARLVVGHHPHVTQTVEEYAGAAIFYSLGNLVFDQYQRKETQRGAVAEVEFSGATLSRYRLLDVAVDREGTRFENGEPAWTVPAAEQQPDSRHG